MACTVLGGNAITIPREFTRTIQAVGGEPLGCVNSETTHSNFWSGVVTLDTTSGRFQLTTTNTLQIVTPIGR
jgi:hypothetical protein